MSTFTISEYLDKTYDRLVNIQAEEANQLMHSWIVELHKIRSEMDKSTWDNFCALARSHKITELLTQDPYTKRSIAKPRGYSGDAVMIDYIYRGLSADELNSISKLGQRVFSYTAGASPSARAVRNRSYLMASSIDSTAARISEPHILSVACGHLYEAELSRSVQEGKIARFVALDQDSLSLETISSRYPDCNIATIQAPITDIIRGKIDIGTFDLIYSSGLYDYLSESLAARLTARLFMLLKPAGRLIIPNFVHNFETGAYMEAFMDWRLICRDEADMNALLKSIPPDLVQEEYIFHDEERYIVYLEIIRK